MYDNIEFVIACGGQSTRNFPHAKGLAHKCLMPFGDIRLIDYVLKEITDIGGRHITFVCSDEDTINTFKKALMKDEKTETKLRNKGTFNTSLFFFNNWTYMNSGFEMIAGW